MARDAPTPAQAGPFSVGRWRADPATDTLVLDAREVKLEPRTMRLLVALAERPGEVCSSDDLLDKVWPGVIVTGQSLYQAVGELRATLKADAGTPAFIANVPRKGYRLVAPVSRDEPTSPARVAAASARMLHGAAMRTIAVLPFRDLGLPAPSGFMREVLLGDLVLELSRQPGLATIARGTMLAYRDHATPPRQIAQELGARYVVDGSIAHVGARLAIACELIDGASGTVLASESIEVPAAHWPEIGQRVVGRLARALRLEVSEHAAGAMASPPGADTGALEIAMRAWVELYCRPQNSDTNNRAWQWAEEAVRRDATIGAAWNALACCEYRAAQYDWHDGDRDELFAQAATHAERATALAPSDPDAHYTLGLILFTMGESARAQASLMHCVQISASYAPAYGLLALVSNAAGRPQQAFELCDRALGLSPREPLRAIWHWGAACAASMLGRDEESLTHAARGIAANPTSPQCHVGAAVAAWRLGRKDEAARCVAALRATAFGTVARLRERVPSMRVEPWASAFLADLRAAGLPDR